MYIYIYVYIYIEREREITPVTCEMKALDWLNSSIQHQNKSYAACLCNSHSAKNGSFKRNSSVQLHIYEDVTKWKCVDTFLRIFVFSLLSMLLLKLSHSSSR